MTYTIIALLLVCAFAAFVCVKAGGKGSGILQRKGRAAHAEPAPDGGAKPDGGGSASEYAGKSAKDLLVAVLRQLNCKVEFDEENADKMFFTYQGENFCAVASNDCLVATLYDFAWGGVDLDDLDEVSMLRKAINDVNMYTPVTLVYTIDKDENKMIAHTKRQVLMVPQIPDLEKYLAAMLSSFFDVQRSLAQELDNLCKEKA